jgi:hypothetical protein
MRDARSSTLLAACRIAEQAKGASPPAPLLTQMVPNAASCAARALLVPHSGSRVLSSRACASPPGPRPRPHPTGRRGRCRRCAAWPASPPRPWPSPAESAALPSRSAGRRACGAARSEPCGGVEDEGDGQVGGPSAELPPTAAQLLSNCHPPPAARCRHGCQPAQRGAARRGAHPKQPRVRALSSVPASANSMACSTRDCPGVPPSMKSTRHRSRQPGLRGRGRAGEPACGAPQGLRGWLGQPAAAAHRSAAEQQQPGAPAKGTGEECSSSKESSRPSSTAAVSELYGSWPLCCAPAAGTSAAPLAVRAVAAPAGPDTTCHGPGSGPEAQGASRAPTAGAEPDGMCGEVERRPQRSMLGHGDLATASHTVHARGPLAGDHGMCAPAVGSTPSGTGSGQAAESAAAPQVQAAAVCA